MWAIPVFFCLKFWWMRFLIIWVIYSGKEMFFRESMTVVTSAFALVYRSFSTIFTFTVCTGFIVFRASRASISRSTPRLVYKWFLLIYKMSYAVGIIG